MRIWWHYFNSFFTEIQHIYFLIFASESLINLITAALDIAQLKNTLKTVNPIKYGANVE